MSFISTVNVSVIDPDANHLDLSLSGFYPVKVSSLRDFEIQPKDMIRILSHAEIFSFLALKCLQSGYMDSRVFSSPEPLGSQGELIVYPSSRRPSSVRRRRKQFQTSSSPKPLGRSKPNFMWSLLG